MAGFVINILSDKSLGLPANAQSNTGGAVVLGPFKQVLQQTSSQSADLTKSYLASSDGSKSGKDLPYDLSFSTQSFAAGSILDGNDPTLEWSDLPDENKAILQTDIFGDVAGGDLSAYLMKESVSPEQTMSPKSDTSLEPALSPNTLVSIEPQSRSNHSIFLPKIADIDSVENLQSSSHKLVVSGQITKNISSLQKGNFAGVSISGPTINSKAQNQSGQSIERVAKIIGKFPLAESAQLTLDEQKTKPIVEASLQGIKYLQPMKNGISIDEEDPLEIIKPEISKLNKFLTKLNQVEGSNKTDIGPIAVQLKNSNGYQQAITAASSNTIETASSELDSMSSANKTIFAASIEMTTNPAKDSKNIAANSAIQSGLSFKRNFSANLATRIQWIYQQAISSAEILMDPPELGPLSVKLTNNNGETSVLFQVSNPSTKEAIEDNLAKLKELLAEQGINLGDTQVEQQHKNDKNENLNEAIADDPSQEFEQQNEPLNVQIQQGLLDTYI